MSVVFDVNFEKFIVELNFIIISSMFEKFFKLLETNNNLIYKMFEINVFVF